MHRLSYLVFTLVIFLGGCAGPRDFMNIQFEPSDVDASVNTLGALPDSRPPGDPDDRIVFGRDDGTEDYDARITASPVDTYRRLSRRESVIREIVDLQALELEEEFQTAGQWVRFDSEEITPGDIGGRTQSATLSWKGWVRGPGNVNIEVQAHADGDTFTPRSLFTIQFSNGRFMASNNIFDFGYDTNLYPEIQSDAHKIEIRFDNLRSAIISHDDIAHPATLRFQNPETTFTQEVDYFWGFLGERREVQVRLLVTVDNGARYYIDDVKLRKNFTISLSE